MQKSHTRTSLHRASKWNAPEAIGSLLTAGADVDVRDDAGMTPLHMAAITGAANAIELLVDVGANVGAEDEWGWTPLHRALSGPLLAGRFLGFGFGWRKFLKFRNRQGETWLHLAARYARSDVLSVLLRICSAARGDSVLNEVSPDKRGRSPLHLAAATGETETVKILLAAGAELDSTDDAGRTPLHLAAAAFERRLRFSSGSEVVRMLLAAGAEPERVDDRGETPLDVARKHGMERAEAILTDRTSLGWPLADKHLQGERLLALAAERNAAYTIRRLVTRGADPAAKIDGAGGTALHVAAEANSVHAITALLAAGVDIDAVNNFGRTAVYCAVTFGRPEAVKVLVEAGARLDLVGDQGWPAVDEACYRLRDWCTDPVESALMMTPVGLAPYRFTPFRSPSFATDYRVSPGHNYVYFNDADGRLLRIEKSREELARLQERQLVRLVSEPSSVELKAWIYFAALRLVTNAAGWPSRRWGGGGGVLEEVLSSITVANESWPRQQNRLVPRTDFNHPRLFR